MSSFDKPLVGQTESHEVQVHSEDWDKTFDDIMKLLADEYKEMARANLSQAIDEELEFRPVSLKDLPHQNLRNYEYLIDFDPAIRRLGILIINRDNDLYKELEIQESNKKDEIIKSILGNIALADELDRIDGVAISELRKREEEGVGDELKALRELRDEAKEQTA
jgi:hypothetical protein